MDAIAREVGVSKSSVSLWTRDVEFVARQGWTGPRHRSPNALQRRKEAEIAELLDAGRRRIGQLSERELLVAGVMLYAGEGAKTDGSVKLANTDPRLMTLFCVWLRTFFSVDEGRLRARLYLHQGLDLEAATTHWSELTGIPPSQFGKPYRAIPDPGIRKAKHPFGCLTVTYACSRTHRTIMGLMSALLDTRAFATLMGFPG